MGLRERWVPSETKELAWLRSDQPDIISNAAAAKTVSRKIHFIREVARGKLVVTSQDGNVVL